MGDFGDRLDVLDRTASMENEILNVNKLSVTPVLQDFNYDCGRAVVKTLLKSLGRETDDALLQDNLKTNPRTGTHPTRIVSTLRQMGLNLVEKVGAELADLEKMVSEGYYCLVVYQAWGSRRERRRLESGHYSLVYAVDGESVHLADPLVEESDGFGMGEGLKRMPKLKFDNDWRDQDYRGEVYDHWMLAVKS